MQFINLRDLQNDPDEVWERLRKSDLVVTADGEVRGILVRVGEDGLEEPLATLRRARAMTALARLRKGAAESGAATLPRDEIEQEIQAVREARKR
ncbi:MAG: hypothetical protein ACOC5J_02630 [Gemmatimonadota bacterium]